MVFSVSLICLRMEKFPAPARGPGQETVHQAKISCGRAIKSPTDNQHLLFSAGEVSTLLPAAAPEKGKRKRPFPYPFYSGFIPAQVSPHKEVFLPPSGSGIPSAPGVTWQMPSRANHLRDMVINTPAVKLDTPGGQFTLSVSGIPEILFRVVDFATAVAAQ